MPGPYMGAKIHQLAQTSPGFLCAWKNSTQFTQMYQLCIDRMQWGGYKCDTCGHLESAKQLSGYANVKGVYTPQTTGAAQAAKASTIPQTSDDMPIIPIVVISIAALLGLGVTAYLKKKKQN